ncbi:hypothetical protein MOD71_18615 [Bacillus haynesii]|uniref:hypothetical protein n=1 Tax=Bacillus haynesii TaxID=1925021 RepID=UPI00227F9446|nr:hypothetical protein [Bacillus haynesii]MCY8737520.1 hypothetical protein [Bacillus haynesii]
MVKHFFIPLFLVLISSIIICGLSYYYEDHYEKVFEEKAVVQNGVVKDKVVNEGGTYMAIDTAMLAATGVAMTTTETEDDDYILIVDVKGEKYEVSTTADIFNEKAVGQKVKFKKYKDEIEFMD